MNKNFFLTWLLLATLITTGCSRGGKLKPENFTVTPTPLEYVSGEVPANINVRFPKKFMKKNIQISCIPVLRYNGMETEGTAALYQGENVPANHQVVSYKKGGTVTFRTTFPFVEEMWRSDLYMTFDARKFTTGKTVKIPEVKIGYGVNCTAALVSQTIKSANNAIAPDNFQRSISQKQTATIKFLIAQAQLRGSELNSSTVKDFISTLQKIKTDEQSLVLRQIDISAYASPDGSYTFNEKLAENRGNNSAQFVREQLKRNRLNGPVDTHYTAEDWEGFKELVSQSNLPDKDLILRVLSMYQDPEQREHEIKNIATIYGELATAVLPELRRARMTINYDVIGKSDEEIMQLYRQDASKLTIEELLYAGNTIATDIDSKEEIFNRVVSLFPNDYRAYNNLADLAIRRGMYNTAYSYLQDAQKLNDKAPEVNNNLGTIALIDGDFVKAEELFAKGTTAANSTEMAGNLLIVKGQYAKAAQTFQGINTNSAALAQILSRDYASAATTLTKIAKPDATTCYLAAILAARQNNSNEVIVNLRQAFEGDPDYIRRANNDLEFTNFSGIVSAIAR